MVVSFHFNIFLDISKSTFNHNCVMALLIQFVHLTKDDGDNKNIDDDDNILSSKLIYVRKRRHFCHSLLFPFNSISINGKIQNILQQQQRTKLFEWIVLWTISESSFTHVCLFVCTHSTETTMNQNTYFGLQPNSQKPYSYFFLIKTIFNLPKVLGLVWYVHHSL